MLFNIKCELKRAVFSKTALLTFFIILISLLIGFSNGLKHLNDLKSHYDSIDVFLKYVGYDGSINLLCFIAPLLATLVFSNSYLQDKNSNFLKFIYLRIDKKRYIISRIIVNALSSGIIIVTALTVFLIIIISLLGLKTNPDSIFNITGPFAFLYQKSKWIYIVYFIINSFIFNTIFSTLALGLSPFINNKYLSFLSSFVIYIISMTLFPYIGLSAFNMGLLFLTNTAVNELFIIIYQSALLILGIILFYLGVSYRNEKDL